MADFKSGALLYNRYHILKALGQGGMGAVYLAEDTRLPGLRVAIKENLNASPDAQAQFQREAVILARLRHPGLPTVTDYFIGPSGRQYLVMEYVRGSNLEQHLRAYGPMREAEALRCMRQLMAALHYMHTWRDPDTGQKRAVIHRDIKPANIKQTPDGRYVLVDFGIAKFSSGTTTVVSARALTPGYAPIEQYHGGTDHRSDIYALGATLYSLLSAHMPPSATSMATGEPLPPLRRWNISTSPKVESVIRKAMALQPSDRFQSIDAMHRSLFDDPLSFTSSRRGDSGPADQEVFTGAVKRSRSVIAGLLLLIMATILIGGGAYFISSRRGSSVEGENVSAPLTGAASKDSVALAAGSQDDVRGGAPMPGEIATEETAPVLAPIATTITNTTSTPLSTAIDSPAPTDIMAAIEPPTATDTAAPPVTAPSTHTFTLTDMPIATSTPMADLLATETAISNQIAIAAAATIAARSTSTPLQTSTPAPRPTPVPTSTPVQRATPVPIPTTPPTCGIPADPLLASGWDRDALGCATDPATITWASYTPYQTGLVVWREDLYRIYGFFNNAGWQSVPDQWDGSSTTPSRGEPPPGFKTPIRGTGWVWGTNDTFFNNLGWAAADQTGFCAMIQDFEKGFLLRSSDVERCHPVHSNPHRDTSFLFLQVQNNGAWQRLR